MDKQSLCRLLWLVTNVQPKAKAVNFRARTYKELRDKFKVANARVVKKMGKENFDTMVSHIHDAAESDIQKLAAERGYKEEWWMACQGKKAQKATHASGRSSTALPPTEGSAVAHGGSGHLRRQFADQVGAVGVAMPGGIEDQLLPFCLVLLPQILPVPAPAHVQTQILGAIARAHRR
jgi:hypothetical protein